MKNLWFALLFAYSSIAASADTKPSPTLAYKLNLNDRSEDTFKVKLLVSGLKPENAIYQFASTAPGTYQVMDMGRYVRSFKAFDKNGKELKTEKITVNQWKIADVTKTAEIRYSIAETWDSVVKENHVYEMCGSSLENDHALINGQTIFGYPTGLQGLPMTLAIERPADWKVGTALDTNAQGQFVAKNYDHIVDSPILLGRLTKAQTVVKGSAVEIYAYSKTDKIKAEQLLSAMQDMLNAAGEFMRELPVKRYTFLWHFEDKNVGAWEHSYSSEYVLAEQEYTPEAGQGYKDISAHEFFHVITPLNIHSEIIERFNFVTPTASEHLWLYEGTTEWAAHVMQLRSNLITLDQYLKTLNQKVNIDTRFFDRNYSLSKISLTSYSVDGQKQYGNIYMRGALVAGLLDIRLLELSGGKRGLREVVLELAKKYGQSKPFAEKQLFDEITKMTYPEIGKFFDDYVKNPQPLPFKEYYEKIGISYYEVKPLTNDVVDVAVKADFKDGKLVVADYKTSLDTCGIREGDEITSLNGEKVNVQSGNQFGGLLTKQKIGGSYTLTVMRDGKEQVLTLPVLTKKGERQFVFELNPNAYKKQIALREVWMRNLK